MVSSEFIFVLSNLRLILNIVVFKLSYSISVFLHTLFNFFCCCTKRSAFSRSDTNGECFPDFHVMFIETADACIPDAWLFVARPNFDKCDSRDFIHKKNSFFTPSAAFFFIRIVFTPTSINSTLVFIFDGLSTSISINTRQHDWPSFIDEGHACGKWSLYMVNPNNLKYVG